MSKLIKRGWLILPVIIILIIGGFLYKGLGKDPSILPSSLINQPWPDFSAENLFDATKLETKQSFIGEPALVNVWATWCPTCKAEHEFLNNLKEQQGIKVFGINYHDDRQLAIRWLEELGNPYEITVFDPNGVLGIELGVVGAPETYLIDADGTIVAKHIGELNSRNWPDLESQYFDLMKDYNDAN